MKINNKKPKQKSIEPNNNLKNIIKDLEEKLLRSLADYTNLQKRVENQQQFITTLATISIVTKMIDVLDDLKLSQSHLKDQGLQMIINKFINVLKSEGLSEIDALNKPFDPETMECVDTKEGEEEIVVEIRKNGYKLNNQVIRPAHVVVNKKVKN